MATVGLLPSWLGAGHGTTVDATAAGEGSLKPDIHFVTPIYPATAIATTNENKQTVIQIIVFMSKGLTQTGRKPYSRYAVTGAQWEPLDSLQRQSRHP